MWDDTATITGWSHLLCIQQHQTIKALNTFLRALFTSLVQQFSAALADEGSKFQHFIEILLLPVAGGKNGTGGIPGLPLTHPLWKLCDSARAA